jgi:ABC-type transporter MlaC component
MLSKAILRLKSNVKFLKMNVKEKGGWMIDDVHQNGISFAQVKNSLVSRMNEIIIDVFSLHRMCAEIRG